MRGKIFSCPDGVELIESYGYHISEDTSVGRLNKYNSKIAVFFTDDGKLAAYSPMVKLKKKTVSALKQIDGMSDMILTPKALAAFWECYLAMIGISIVSCEKCSLSAVLAFLSVGFQLPLNACGLCVISADKSDVCRKFFEHEIIMSDSVIYADLV